jgi:hypothetical protein
LRISQLLAAPVFHPKKDIEIEKNKKTPFGQEVSVI